MKTKKEFVSYLNGLVTDRDDDRWIIGGKNRWTGRNNYGLMLKRYDPVAFEVGFYEWRNMLINGGTWNE